MLATSGPLPARDEDWAFEVKWDGARCVLTTEGDGAVHLASRAGSDVTVTYPELQTMGGFLRSSSVVLDGEVVALDPAGRPDFGLLQRRMGVANPRRATHLAREIPVHLMIFDVMFLDGRLLLDSSYRERRQILSGLGLAGPHWSSPHLFTGTMPRHGTPLCARVWKGWSPRDSLPPMRRAPVRLTGARPREWRPWTSSSAAGLRATVHPGACRARSWSAWTRRTVCGT
jgi:bifunctional non-homologous end joining protein LigD